MSYYKIGDIYCKMEKLDEALEKYEIAKADNLHYYMPMHTNLVDLYCKRNDYSKAAKEEEEILTILRKQLSNDFIKMAEEKYLNIRLSAFETIFKNR
ncbi:unnamed protein product, partial [Rotaria sp. Silwood1]